MAPDRTMVRKHLCRILILSFLIRAEFFCSTRLRLVRGKNFTADKKGIRKDERRWGNAVEPFRMSLELLVVGAVVSGQTVSSRRETKGSYDVGWNPEGLELNWPVRVHLLLIFCLSAVEFVSWPNLRRSNRQRKRI